MRRPLPCKLYFFLLALPCCFIQRDRRENRYTWLPVLTFAHMRTSAHSFVQSRFVSCVAPSFEGPVVSEQQAALEAGCRAKQIVWPGTAARLFGSAEYGGLTVLRCAVGFGIIRQAWLEASTWCDGGRMRTTGQELQGRTDIMCYLIALETTASGTLAMTYVISLLHSICEELNCYRSSGMRHLVPEATQFACYDGKGARYTIHRDSYSPDVLDDSLGEQVKQHIGSRRVTLILYLQPSWKAELGGALRAYSTAVDSGERDEGHLDILPRGGNLVLFRSRDLPHEVMPCLGRRCAFIVWCREV
jgi:predicted 2-oxoglutarate/Fe(II)-dependent dioxygenase YbiX